MLLGPFAEFTFHGIQFQNWMAIALALITLAIFSQVSHNEILKSATTSPKPLLFSPRR
jgi:hypothetical protein